MQQTMVIMQGASGSGKTTVADGLAMTFYTATHCATGRICAPALVCSTDDYFHEDDDSPYSFNKTLLPKAHKWNQDRVRSGLSKGRSVIVDNTNLRKWEARPYVEMAVEFKVPVLFVRCTGEFANIHGVPEEVVEKMLSDMEDLSVESCLQAKYPWEKSNEVE